MMKNIMRTGIATTLAGGVLLSSAVLANASVIAGSYVDDPMNESPSVQVSLSEEGLQELSEAGYELDVDKMNSHLEKQLSERPTEMPRIPVITEGETTAPNTAPTERYEDGDWLAIGSQAVGTQEQLPEMTMSEGQTFSASSLTSPTDASIYFTQTSVGNASSTGANFVDGEHYRSVSVPARSAWNTGWYESDREGITSDADVSYFMDNYTGDLRDEHLAQHGSVFPDENMTVVYENDEAGFWLQGLDRIGTDTVYTVTTAPVWVSVHSTFGNETPVEGENWVKTEAGPGGSTIEYSLSLSESLTRPSADDTWHKTSAREGGDTISGDLELTGGIAEGGVIYNGHAVQNATVSGNTVIFTLKDGDTAADIAAPETIWLKQWGDVHIRADRAIDGDRLVYTLTAYEGRNGPETDLPTVVLEPDFGGSSGAGSVWVNSHMMGGYALDSREIPPTDQEEPPVDVPGDPAPPVEVPGDPEPPVDAPGDPEPPTEVPGDPDTPVTISAGIERAGVNPIAALTLAVGGLLAGLAYRLRNRGGSH